MVLFVAVCFETELYEVAQVSAEVVVEGGEQVEGRAGGEDENHQDKSKGQVHLTQHFDAFAYAGGGGGDCQTHDGENHDGLYGKGVFAYPADLCQARTQLRRAETKRGDDAEQGGDQREYVDDVACLTVDFLFQQRIKAGAQGKREFVAEGEIGERQRHGGVNRPGMYAPVEEGVEQRVLLPCATAAFGDGGQIVGERFGDAEKHQPDAHTRREQHGEPRPKAKFRLFFVAAQFDVAEAADRKCEQEEEEG